MKEKTLTELIYDEHCPGWDKTEGEELAEITHADACPAFKEAADRIKETIVRMTKAVAEGRVYELVVEYPRKPIDPIDRLVDGLTVRECLERYTAWQREDVRETNWAKTETVKPPYARREYLTIAQVHAARLAWSAELKRKQQEAEAKERASVCVDDDRWEP